jgi:cell division transport system permease protein
MTNVEKISRQQTPILHSESIAGRTLTLSIAIMSFLCALTIGGVDLIMQSAFHWQAQVAREVSVQIKPVEGRNLEEDVRKTLEILRATKGVTLASALSNDQSAKLLEPWVGNSDLLQNIPLPRLIAVQYDTVQPPDFEVLRANLLAQTPNVFLEDHKQPQDRFRKMAHTFILLGLTLVIVMSIATFLTVIFATRATIATAHNVLEVLHFVGAKDAFIARLFERRFLVIGLQGAGIGALGTGLLLLLLYFHFSISKTSASADQMQALFGSFQPSFWGIVSMLAMLLFIALMSAITTRITVMKSLSEID